SERCQRLSAARYENIGARSPTSSQEADDSDRIGRSVRGVSTGGDEFMGEGYAAMATVAKSTGNTATMSRRGICRSSSQDVRDNEKQRAYPSPAGNPLQS